MCGYEHEIYSLRWIGSCVDAVEGKGDEVGIHDRGGHLWHVEDAFVERLIAPGIIEVKEGVGS